MAAKPLRRATENLKTSSFLLALHSIRHRILQEEAMVATSSGSKFRGASYTYSVCDIQQSIINTLFIL